MQRREFILMLGGAAVAVPLTADAQQKTIPVVGFLHGGSRAAVAANVAAFHQSLRENGYIIGQNVAVEYRWAEGNYDRLPAMAGDLVARKVNVIVAGGGTPPTLAAKGATSTIPIVFANVGNPVEQGLVASLARPGGNLTGISILFAELTQKRLELLTELVPQARMIGLFINPNNPMNESTIADPQEAARAKGVQLSILKATSADQIETAFAQVARLHVNALLVSPDPLFFTRRERVVALASRHAIPAMYGWREFVEAGGLSSYAPSGPGTYRQTARYVAKILNGAKPADLPVEQPTNFELVLNLKTAQALGLTVPSSLLARADEVIE